MSVFELLLDVSHRRGSAYLVLLDPDNVPVMGAADAAEAVSEGDADGILIGGSLLRENNFRDIVRAVKNATDLPVIIFPGSAEQLSPDADALLFLSLISGRNPEKLIGEQVKAAPVVKSYGLEAIPTGYMLIESGGMTAVQYISGSQPIPRKKEGIAVAHALAAELLGMKAIYLEAGSGAELPVPLKMVSAVVKGSNLPVFVGGGIRSPEVAELRARAGAHFIVTGTVLEPESNIAVVKEFARAVHWKE